jgi:hypothetical protein
VRSLRPRSAPAARLTRCRVVVDGGWDFNENDACPVRIGDPHLQQAHGSRWEARRISTPAALRRRCSAVRSEPVATRRDGTSLCRPRRRRFPGDSRRGRRRAQDHRGPRIHGRRQDPACPGRTVDCGCRSAGRSKIRLLSTSMDPIMPPIGRAGWQPGRHRARWLRDVEARSTRYRQPPRGDRACASPDHRRRLANKALVEIVPRKGSGQLKKRVLRFLDRKEIKL